MGNIIRVDHADLKRTAERLDDAADEIVKSLNDAVSHAEVLSHGWIGNDSSSFVNHARGLKSSDSTVMSAAAAMRSFAEWARKAAEMYIDAQTEAVNKANSL